MFILGGPECTLLPYQMVIKPKTKEDKGLKYISFERRHLRVLNDVSYEIYCI